MLKRAIFVCAHTGATVSIVCVDNGRRRVNVTILTVDAVCRLLE